MSKSRTYVGPWFRAYAADRRNWQLQKLPVAVRWTWFELACLASETNGRLPDVEQAAFDLRTTTLELESHINALIDAGLIIQAWNNSVPYLEMSGWNTRQFVADKSAPRMRKMRGRKKPVTVGDGVGDVTCDGESDGKPVVYSTTSALDESLSSSYEHEEVTTDSEPLSCARDGTGDDEVSL